MGRTLDRVYAVAWALRRGVDRAALNWIAHSAEDDSLPRPVNIPGTPHPQADLEVEVQPFGVSRHRLRVRTRYTIARREIPRAPRAQSRVLPEDPQLVIEPGERVLVFIHGHSSRLEEVETMIDPLTERGFTIVSMDLPTCGYAQMIDHTTVASDANTDSDRNTICNINAAHRKLVCIRMFFSAQYFSDNNTGNVQTLRFYFVNFEAHQTQSLCQSFGVHLNIDEFFKPIV